MFSIKAAVKQFNDALAEAKRKAQESKTSMEFYEDRVEKLTKAVATINETLSDNDLLTQDEVTKERKKRQKNDLPQTDGDFWIGLVTNEFQNGPAILINAANKLNIAQDDKTQINLLKMRQSFHLVRLESQGKIKAIGKGRGKTYALAA